MCQQVTKSVKGYRRYARVIVPFNETTGSGAIAIVTERVARHYWLRKCPSDLGDGFVLAPDGTDETHLVELSDEACQCSCKAFRYGRGPCKHIGALQALRRTGAI